LSGSAAAHTTPSDKVVLESTIQITGLRAEVDPHGERPMQLVPSGNSGNFFNRQSRSTVAVQWVEAMTGMGNWGGVAHLFKAGIDVMRSAFTGRSVSRTMSIRRDDGTQARVMNFSGPVKQNVTATDLALFAQDRIQPHPRLLLEFGGRVDRDGVLDRTNATPRVGAILLMTPKGTAIIRGGYGLFFERTPSVVGAFDQFETSGEMRFQRDGVTPLGAVREYRHVASTDLDVARSTTWNLQYDQRVGRGLSFRASVLSRDGANELIVNPVVSPLRGLTELRLSSAGRSDYTEGEFTVRYAPSRSIELGATYARSSAYANLNAYTAFFDNIRWPVIGRDEYAPVASHVPHRFIGHTRTIFANRVLLSTILELHTGFPYSATDDMLDWVGPRNQVFHFPTVALLDLGVEHRFTFIKGKPWIGLRAYNALNRFTPTEAQTNMSSPMFGAFYNSYGRQFRLQVRLQP
jgi:TonB dependent receptor